MKNLRDNDNSDDNEIKKHKLKSGYRLESVNNIWFFSDVNEFKTEFSKRKIDHKEISNSINEEISFDNLIKKLRTNKHTGKEKQKFT